MDTLALQFPRFAVKVSPPLPKPKMKASLTFSSIMVLSSVVDSAPAHGYCSKAKFVFCWVALQWQVYSSTEHVSASPC
jgi:hypothetical protein